MCKFKVKWNLVFIANVKNEYYWTGSVYFTKIVGNKSNSPGRSQNKYLIIVVIQLLSHVWLFATPWTAAHQAPLSSTIAIDKTVLKSHKKDKPKHIRIYRNNCKWHGNNPGWGGEGKVGKGMEENKKGPELIVLETEWRVHGELLYILLTSVYVWKFPYTKFLQRKELCRSKNILKLIKLKPEDHHWMGPF